MTSYKKNRILVYSIFFNLLFISRNTAEGTPSEETRPEIAEIAGIDGIKGEVSETLSSPKVQAWKQWLETTGNALGRKEDDIEINGDIVTVKIPGYKDLVFNPSEYKLRSQKFADNKNKFSKVDFEKLVEFLGGDNSKRYWRAGANAVPFFRDVLGLETGRFYWSSGRCDLDGAWGLGLGEDVVNVVANLQGSRNSAIVSQN